VSAGTHTFGAAYAQYYTCYSTTTGGSPAARTVTFDWFTGANTAIGVLHIVSVPDAAATIPQSKNASTATSTESLTITLPGAPSAANTVIAFLGVNTDTPFVVQAVPSGYTVLYNTVPVTYAFGAVYYAAGITTAAVTSTDVGNGVSSTGGVLIEVAASGGGGATSYALTATGTGTSTGSLAVGGLPTNLTSTGTGNTGGSFAVNATSVIAATGAGTSTGTLAATITFGPASLALASTGHGTTTGHLAVIRTGPGAGGGGGGGGVLTSGVNRGGFQPRNTPAERRAFFDHKRQLAKLAARIEALEAP